MSIRFQCGSCSQPIEVDDEWAAKMVACPFCRKTVTAPAESTLEDPAGVPMATPVVAAHAAPDGAPLMAPVPSRNLFALVALVASGSVILCFGAGTIIANSHSLEIADIAERLSNLEGGGSQMGAMMDYLDSRGGGMPAWLVMLTVLQLAGLSACLVAIVCGLLGMRQPHRRSMAVAALIISGGMVMLFCGSAISGIGCIRPTLPIL